MVGLVTTLFALGAVSVKMRAVIMVAFVVLMFAVAGLALVVGRRAQEARNAKRLSADTGTSKGAKHGADHTHSEAWLAAATTEEETPANRQSWQEAFLGPDTVTDPVAPSSFAAPADPAVPVAEVVSGWEAAADPAPAYAPAGPAPVPVAPQAPAFPGMAAPAPASVEATVGYQGKRRAAVPTDTPSGFLVDNGLDED